MNSNHILYLHISRCVKIFSVCIRCYNPNVNFFACPVLSVTVSGINVSTNYVLTIVHLIALFWFLQNSPSSDVVNLVVARLTFIAHIVCQHLKDVTGLYIIW